MISPVDPRDALVASPHFEWCEGMRNAEGEMVIATSRGLRLAACDGQTLDQITDVDRPDLDHGGTQGEMLALVRKAWGPDFEIRIVVDDDGAECSVYRSALASERPGEFVKQCLRETLGLALAAALLAAPPEVPRV